MLKKGKVGVVTFSDGRPAVYESLRELNRRDEAQLVARLQEAGWEVVQAPEPVWSNESARVAARRLQDSHCDVALFHFNVWSFPHLPMLTARMIQQPIVLLCNVNPEYPGMVGMLAGAGALDQIGRTHTRVWGRIDDPKVLGRLESFLLGGAAVCKLKGQTFGLFGGRPMGMYTAVANPDQWMEIFGVDVEHIDQWEIVRRSADVPQDRITRARRWLEAHVRKVHYDGKQLTPETLERQIRSYYAVKSMVEEKHLDFCGIKAQPELTDHFCTMDITEAFLNDPYDWDGPHDPIVCATEADMDAAMTMQILKLLARTPVLFADVRFYHQDLGIFDLANSGEHATYFAGHSFLAEENLSKVELYPEGFYFPAGGASVQHLAAPGEATFARLMRKNGRYWLAILSGEFVQFDSAQNKHLMEMTQIEWPHAFARLYCSEEEFFTKFSANHIHAVYGNYVESLKAVAEYLGVEYRIFGR